ncbi:MAG: carbonic anhydrase [Promethearchaeota archaeon]
MDDILLKNMISVHEKRLSLGKKYFFEEWDSPALKKIIITCMDPRVDLHDIMGLKPGDAYVIRNAGNLITVDVIRSILLVMATGAPIEEIVIIGHIDCGVNLKNFYESQNNIETIASLLKSSNLKRILEDKEKIIQYFGFFENEIKNLIEQASLLSFLERIDNDVKISVYFYNIYNGFLYDLDEFNELVDILPSLEKDKWKKIVPARYKEFVKTSSFSSDAIGGLEKRSKPSTRTSFKEGKRSSSGRSRKSNRTSRVDSGGVSHVNKKKLTNTDITKPGEKNNEVFQEVLNEMSSNLTDISKKTENLSKSIMKHSIFSVNVRIPKIKVRVPGLRNIFDDENIDNEE